MCLAYTSFGAKWLQLTGRERGRAGQRAAGDGTVATDARCACAVCAEALMQLRCIGVRQGSEQQATRQKRRMQGAHVLSVQKRSCSSGVLQCGRAASSRRRDSSDGCKVRMCCLCRSAHAAQVYWSAAGQRAAGDGTVATDARCVCAVCAEVLMQLRCTGLRPGSEQQATRQKRRMQGPHVLLLVTYAADSVFQGAAGWGTLCKRALSTTLQVRAWV